MESKKKRTTLHALIEIFINQRAPRIKHTDSRKELDGLALDVPFAQRDLNEVVDKIALL